MIKEGDTESGGLLAVLQFDSIWFSTEKGMQNILPPELDVTLIATRSQLYQVGPGDGSASI